MLVGQVGNVLHQVGLVDTIGYLSHHNLVVGLSGLNLGLGTHHDTATTSLVGVANTLQSVDIGSRGEVRTRDVLHQPVGVNVGVVDIGTAAVNDLAQVVGGHVGGHTYGNTVATIDQQVRYLGRHHAGLYQRVVEVVHHVDGFLLQVVHDVLAHLGEAALCITHGGR